VEYARNCYGAEIHPLGPDTKLHGKITNWVGKRVGKFRVESREAIKVYDATKSKECLYGVVCACGERLILGSDRLAANKNKPDYCCPRCAHQRRAEKPRLRKTRTNPGLHANTPEYMAWGNMKARCTNPSHPRWKDYGARGVTVCDEWKGKGGFERFLESVGNRPEPVVLPNGKKLKYSLERVRNDGNYEPGNVAWATSTKQSRNRRTNVIVILDSEFMVATDAADKLGIPASTLLGALRSGKSFEEWMQHRTGTEPEFTPQGKLSFRSPSIRRKLAETISFIYEACDPPVFSFNELGTVLDLSGESVRRWLRGLSVPSEPGAEKLADFLDSYIKQPAIQANLKAELAQAEDADTPEAA
jgi:hypothetical protein